MSGSESTSPAHSIRLRGPWEYELLDGPRAGERGRIELGGDWHRQLPADAQTVRLTRYFQAPTGIDRGERVFLCLRDFPDASQVLLDEVLLVEHGDCHEITHRLQRRHQLQIACNQIVRSGEVWLEIRS